MSKIVFAVFVTLMAFTEVHAQFDTVKGIQFNAVVEPHTLANTSIENNGNSPFTFYPMYKVPGMEYAFRNDSTYLAWLKSTTNSTNPDQRRLDMVIAEATHIQKTLLFLNNYLIFDEFNSDSRDSVLAKKYSIIGGKLSEAHKQCGNFVLDAEHDIVSSGDEPANFSTVSFTAHTVGQFMFNGEWVKMDMDPQEPGFIDSNKSSLNGYASAQDIVDDPALFQHRYLIPYGTDSMDISYNSSADYRLLFQSPNQYNYNMPQTRKVSGDWTLCAGCKLDRSENMSNDWYFIDTTMSNSSVWSHEILNWMRMYASTNQAAYLDSSGDMLGNALHITSSMAQTRLTEGSMVFGGHYSELLSRLYTSDGPPVLTLTIPAHTDTIVIGRDLKLPFLVRDVTCSSCLIADSLVKVRAEWNLWVKSGTIPFVRANSINYLDSGFFAPQSYPTTVNLYYNPGIYDFSGGFVIDHLGNTGTLVNTNYINQNAVGIASLETDSRASVTAYPNPAQKGVNVTVACGSKFRIFDTEGREQFYETDKIGEGKFSVNFPNAGSYLIFSPGYKTSSVMVF